MPHAQAERITIHEKFYTWLAKKRRDKLIEACTVLADNLSGKDLEMLLGGK